MSRRLTVACVQPNVGDDIGRNITQVSDLIRTARAAGAGFVVTPEMTNFLVMGQAELHRLARPEASDKALGAYRALARELEIWLLLGSLAIQVPGRERLANRGFLLAPDGTIRATYDKIHMFDVDLPGGDRIRESERFEPGAKAQVADLPWGRLGLSICYDLRFPYLYRDLALAGAELITVPAAFTKVTGTAHWHVLQRARAIETGCFVVAAAQCGHHPGDRETFGHSLIVDPWGRVLADAGPEPGIISAEIDLDQVARVRAMVPSLANGRTYELTPAAQAAE